MVRLQSQVWLAPDLFLFSMFFLSHYTSYSLASAIGVQQVSLSIAPDHTYLSSIESYKSCKISTNLTILVHINIYNNFQSTIKHLPPPKNFQAIPLSHNQFNGCARYRTLLCPRVGGVQQKPGQCIEVVNLTSANKKCDD